MTKDKRMYEIACSFPALVKKGVVNGQIPGIVKDDFFDIDLSNYLYNGPGGGLSQGEFLILEALLNLYNSDIHQKFNLGEAVHVLDERNMQSLMNAIARVYHRY